MTATGPVKKRLHAHPAPRPWRMRRVSPGVHKVDGDCPDTVDNRYRVIIDVPGGKQYRKTVIGLRAAEQHYRQKWHELGHEKRERRQTRLLGTPTVNRNITMRQLLEPALATAAKKKQHDPTTTRAYKSLLDNHFWPQWGESRVRDIADEDILTEWLAEIVDTVGVATARRCDQFLRMAMKLAAKKRLIPINPLDDVPWVALAKGTPTYLPTWPEVMAVRHAMVTQTGLVAGHREMSIAAHDLLAGTGVRVGECFGLSPEDVDTETGTVTVRYQVKRLNDGYVFDDAKTDAGKERVIPVPKFVLASLATTKLRNGTRPITLPWVGPLTPTERRRFAETGERPTRTRELYFFSIAKPGAPGNPNGFSVRLRRAGKAAKLKGGLRAHCYRHCYTTALLDGGVPQKIVDYVTGHESHGVTLAVYAHVTPKGVEKVREVIDAAWQEAMTEFTPPERKRRHASSKAS